MLRVKKLYLFVLKTFLPIFFMTFFICLFILLMQFLWKYVDELVGKGLSISVLTELFSYAALNLVPMALPLSILLASLMTFGNLGESLELLAMKSAGISLIRIMRSLIVTLIVIAIGSFYFQNYVMPKVQVKLWGLMFSVRQKSPELDIPERVFYDQIQGYNIYVEKKDPKTGTLRKVMIYDFSQGFDNARVIAADSAKIKMTEDKQFLVFSIFNGESFENFQKQRASNSNSIPYRRESFTLKQILIQFDASFKRVDNSFLQSQYIGKNIAELRHSIDSMEVRIDSVNKVNKKASINTVPLQSTYLQVGQPSDSAFARTFKPINLDSLYADAESGEKSAALSRAIATAEANRQELEYKSFFIDSQEGNINRHYIEWHKKFTLSFACLIFFFIGAPLGAIIRKGGLGLPVVISVILFIIYYMIDYSGYKLARDGKWPAWEGMWLSSFVLLPLGTFLTYKSARDSMILNSDAYMLFFKKLFGKRGKRALERKELVMFNPDINKVLSLIDEQNDLINDLVNSFKAQGKLNYVRFWKEGTHSHQLIQLSKALESLVEEMNNSTDQHIYFKLLEYPVIPVERYNVVPEVKWIRTTLAYLFPIGIVLFINAKIQQKRLLKDFEQMTRINQELSNLIKN
ncbi:LptF/LptG family permease [Parabacteroides sp. FAFU027]|uniref:LptF/LptG family permease n=1 Tax=Parabacteroides sp. FAFU027 TaxID=2922715 RepID=UPI001FAEE386|nr:LptF/LptG family permease [Parabacteroides sp. FAFU027]